MSVGLLVVVVVVDSSRWWEEMGQGGGGRGGSRVTSKEFFCVFTCPSSVPRVRDTLPRLHFFFFNFFFFVPRHGIYLQGNGGMRSCVCCMHVDRAEVVYQSTCQ